MSTAVDSLYWCFIKTCCFTAEICALIITMLFVIVKLFFLFSDSHHRKNYFSEFLNGIVFSHYFCLPSVFIAVLLFFCYCFNFSLFQKWSMSNIFIIIECTCIYFLCVCLFFFSIIFFIFGFCISVMFVTVVVEAVAMSVFGYLLLFLLLLLPGYICNVMSIFCLFSLFPG